MNRSLLLAAMLLLSIANAITVESGAECKAGFSEKVVVKVYDGENSPIEGALVNITYQKDATTGKGYVTSPNVYTDSNGMASFLVVNIETLESRVKCDYTIRASYGGVSSRLDTYYKMPQPFGITINVYPVIIKLLDRYKKTIEQGSVSSNGVPCIKREDYSWKCYGGKGTVFTASFGDSTKEFEEDITNSTYKYYVLDVYQASLLLKDDTGKLVSGIVKVGDHSYQVEGEAPVVAYHQTETVRAEGLGITKERAVDFASTDVVAFIFDIHSPLIGQTTIEGNDDNTKMIIKSHITDTIGVSSAKVLYTVGGKTSQASGVKRGDTYEFTLPVPENYRIVSITIVATDADGNTAQRSGTITITEVKEEGGSKGASTQTGQEGGEVNILLIGAGIIVVLIAIVAFFYFKSKMEWEKEQKGQ
ncbi:MAG: hypothetical protein QW035_03345 [Candidatus Anstonellales archaeon]